MKMAGMSGIELAHAIHWEREISEPRLVMLTPVMRADHTRAAREAGIFAYLNKRCDKGRAYAVPIRNTALIVRPLTASSTARLMSANA